MSIAFAGDIQINQAMARDLIHHVFKKGNTCIEFGLTRAIKVDLNGNLGFERVTLY